MEQIKEQTTETVIDMNNEIEISEKISTQEKASTPDKISTQERVSTPEMIPETIKEIDLEMIETSTGMTGVIETEMLIEKFLTEMKTPIEIMTEEAGLKIDTVGQMTDSKVET